MRLEKILKNNHSNKALVLFVTTNFEQSVDMIYQFIGGSLCLLIA